MGTPSTIRRLRLSRHAAARLIVILLLGMVASVVSAWIPAAIFSWKPSPRNLTLTQFQSRPATPYLPFQVYRWTGIAHEVWMAQFDLLAAQDPTGSPFEPLPEVEWPAHLAVAPEGSNIGAGSQWWGWPWYSMYWQEDLQGVSSGPGLTVWNDVGQHGVWVVDLRSKELKFPLRPHWRGFIANAAAYASLLAALWRGPHALRRVIRARRGECPACGYELAGALGLICPECGSARFAVTRRKEAAEQ